MFNYSAELCTEATNRLQLHEQTLKLSDNELDNCGKMSIKDTIRESHLTENRIMNYIYELNNKVNKLEINSLVSIPFISKSLNIPEEIIIFTLQKNGIELTTVEEEDGN